MFLETNLLFINFPSKTLILDTRVVPMNVVMVWSHIVVLMRPATTADPTLKTVRDLTKTVIILDTTKITTVDNIKLAMKPTGLTREVQTCPTTGLTNTVPIIPDLTIMSTKEAQVCLTIGLMSTVPIMLDPTMVFTKVAATATRLIDLIHTIVTVLGLKKMLTITVIVLMIARIAHIQKSDLMTIVLDLIMVLKIHVFKGLITTLDQPAGMRANKAVQ